MVPATRNQVIWKAEKIMYDKIEKIINEWDPIELFSLEPKDEYNQEIKKVVDILNLRELYTL